MCGLVGILASGIATNPHLKLLGNMLFVDQARGEHATGVAKINTTTNAVSIHKKAMNATKFLASEDTFEFLDKNRGRIYIGHNRFATMGNKGDDENAHPFQYGHITMAHNGTVDSWTLNKLEGHKELKVDSHMVCATIAERGFEEAVKSFSGAFALVWWDANLRTLNFVRNKERPLYTAVLTDGSLVWASQPEFIEFFIAQTKCPLSFRKGGEPEQLAENVWVAYRFNEFGTLVDGGKPVETEVVFTKVVDPNPPRYPATRNQQWWEAELEEDWTNYRSRGNRSVSSGRKTGQQIEAERIEALFTKHKLDLTIGDSIVVTVDRVAACTNSEDRVNVYCQYDGIEAVAYYVPKLVVQGALKLEAPVTLITEKTAPTGFGGVRTIPMLTLNSQKLTRFVGQVIQFSKFPLRVIGHTFDTQEEFHDFVCTGCAVCGHVPTASNAFNKNLKVYPAETFNGLLSDCEFICGKCVEEKLDVIDVQ